MDCDMVVIGDLLLFVQIDLGDVLVVVVVCFNFDWCELVVIGIVQGEYVNVGFLVMNLLVWWQENLLLCCMELLLDLFCLLLSEDQLVVNIVCCGCILYLFVVFNIYVNDLVYKWFEDLLKDVVVLYFVVNMKLWCWCVVFGEVW